ncbi:hypothetical protein ACQPXH_08980 [Nocardia sp. CA-135953]|uniref:hypothetical protein n=1 Tax=Nocardia sp. CA-135953 TaxID=3239978 RepID=UPI003D97D3B9
MPQQTRGAAGQRFGVAHGEGDQAIRVSLVTNQGGAVRGQVDVDPFDARVTMGFLAIGVVVEQPQGGGPSNASVTNRRSDGMAIVTPLPILDFSPTPLRLKVFHGLYRVSVHFLELVVRPISTGGIHGPYELITRRMSCDRHNRAHTVIQLIGGRGFSINLRLPMSSRIACVYISMWTRYRGLSHGLAAPCTHSYRLEDPVITFHAWTPV